MGSFSSRMRRSKSAESRKSPGDQKDASGSAPWLEELCLCQLQPPRCKARENFAFSFLIALRTCEKIRKRRARARKAVWQGAREGASPQRAVTERATRPDGLSCSRPQGCVSFWLGLRCSGGTADRRETACRRQPAGRCKASATPLRVLPPPSRLGQAKNPAATRHFVIFSQVLTLGNAARRAWWGLRGRPNLNITSQSRFFARRSVGSDALETNLREMIIMSIGNYDVDSI